MHWQALLGVQARLATGPVDEWYSALLGVLQSPSPVQIAIMGGRLAATPGLAFLAGYQAALRALWPAAPWSLGALCVTEQRSTRPADLSTRLSGLQLDGSKDFVTAAEHAEWLLVAARVEPAGSAVQLALAVVHRGAPGVQIETLAALALMPDISHGRLTLQAAPCERLPGDGWADYCKPFRTLEDNHVLAALCAWLYGVGQDCAWPQPLQLRLLGVLGGCAEMARQCPSSAAGHVLLAGLFAQFDGLRGELEAALAAGPSHWQQLWQRDQGLLSIAKGARQIRLDKALASLV
jgi:hypothetical protein